MSTEPGTAVAPRPSRLRAMDLAVDVGFGILLLVCALRYFAYHPLSGGGVLVLVLAVGAGFSYAVAVLGRRADPDEPAFRFGSASTRQRVGLLAATAFWLPLVVLAPSFGWCAFALFFAVHRVVRGTAAFILSGIIVVAVSTGLLIMSKGEDLGLVLGPFFGGLVLSYAYAALARALTAQQELNAELIETREQLARSERDAGALAERGRVASELHDTVVQRTAGALLLLESDGLSSGDSSASVSEARDALREALVETRQLMRGLENPRAATASLASLLRSQASDGGAAFSVIGSERAVSEQLAHALQRVVQEALLNARKHARADTVRVTLTYFPDAIGVDIADDGVGLPAAVLPGDETEAERDSTTGGFGIRAMRWRIRSLGGELTIESRPGQGTVVAAVVPDAAEGRKT